jgi:hypothetical protein
MAELKRITVGPANAPVIALKTDASGDPTILVRINGNKIELGYFSNGALILYPLESEDRLALAGYLHFTEKHEISVR